MRAWMLNKKGRELFNQYKDKPGYEGATMRPTFKCPSANVLPYFQEIQVPCGKCLGCLLDRREGWTVRAALELVDHLMSCFITLTYDEKYLPLSGNCGMPTLDRYHFTCFIKRLRKHLAEKKIKIRYFGCGEYGDKFGRPHYHAIIYGWCPQDLVLFKLGETPETSVYTSKELQSLWKYGFTTVAPASFRTCKYVAGYVGKKIFGKAPDGVDNVFTACSLKPAIGSNWFRRYGDSLVKFCINPTGDYSVADCSIRLPNGESAHVPQAFLRWWRTEYPEKHEILLATRESGTFEEPDDEVLAARAALHELLFKESMLKGKGNV